MIAKMVDKSIYIVFGFTFLMGVFSFFTVSKSEEAQLTIQASNPNNADFSDSLRTETEYKVFITTEKSGAETFWQLIDLKTDSVIKSDFLVDVTYKFEEPGTYKIKAYRGQKILSDSIVEVLPGLRVAFDIPADLYVKKEIRLQNESIGASNFLWTLIDENDDTLITDISPQFSWIPEETGVYKVELLGISLNGNEKRIIEEVRVVREPREYVKPVVENNNVDEIASSRRNIIKPVKKSGISFMLGFSPKGSKPIGPDVPSLASVEFRSGSTKIEIKPKQTLRIASISYWGNINDPGNYSYSIVCTSQTDGENKFSRKAGTAKSANEANVDRLNYPRSSALIAGETYELIITSDNPCMGYFNPENDLILADEKYGSFRFLSETSAVFNLKLEY